MNPYQYDTTGKPVSIIFKVRKPLWDQFGVEIPSAYRTRYLGDTRIKGEYFFPRSRQRAPLAVLIHGMGDRSAVPCRLIAHDLARKGVASFILYLVFHTCRATEIIKRHYPDLNSEEWDEVYKISVTDVQQVMDWAITRPEIDSEQTSALGISLGSFITSIAMALDRRIKKGILVECGGNSDKITRDSFLLRWRYKQGMTSYLKNQAAYARYLQEVASHGWENVPAAKISYLTDPLTFACDLKGRPLMLLNANWDEMIPRSATQELWESLGKPPIHWYPATHASLWVWYPLFRRKITDFIKNGVEVK